MKTIQVTRRFVRHEWGGVETAVLETARCLQSAGHGADIVTSAALSTPGDEEIGDVHVSRFQHFYPFLGLSKEARHAMDIKGGNLVSFPLLRHLREEPELDLLHVHTLNRLGGIVRHVARRRQIPYIVSIHGGVHDIPEEQSELLLKPAQGALEWGKVLGWWFGSHQVLEDAAAIICYGRREYELTAERFPNSRVELFPHGVRAERFARGDGVAFRQAHQLPHDACVLLSMARIDPQKDQRLAIRGLRQLLSFEPKAHLVLMGPVSDGEYAELLLREIDECGLGKRVHFVPGVTPDDPTLVDAFHAADVFVLPSMHEVFGIVVLEAWATGLPVVASDVGGIQSLVRDGRDGLLFEPGDVEGFVQCCRTMLHDRELADRVRIDARDRVEQEFSWARITERLIGLYEEVGCACIA